jgi:hypothetical protein
VALTWYIPIFLTWQKERFIEEGKEVVELDHAINRIVGLLENILDIPYGFSVRSVPSLTMEAESSNCETGTLC